MNLEEKESKSPSRKSMSPGNKRMKPSKKKQEQDAKAQAKAEEQTIKEHRQNLRDLRTTLGIQCLPKKPIYLVVTPVDYHERPGPPSPLKIDFIRRY